MFLGIGEVKRKIEKVILEMKKVVSIKNIGIRKVNEEFVEEGIDLG